MMNARSMAGMEQHPDIMEPRARYELATATPLALFADGLIFLTGLYLAISPWVAGFNASLRSLAVNDLITGRRWP
jgi:SPW repeat